MKTSTVVMLGGIGVLGYLLYTSAKAGSSLLPYVDAPGVYVGPNSGQTPGQPPSGTYAAPTGSYTPGGGGVITRGNYAGGYYGQGSAPQSGGAYIPAANSNYAATWSKWGPASSAYGSTPTPGGIPYGQLRGMGNSPGNWQRRRRVSF